MRCDPRLNERRLVQPRHGVPAKFTPTGVKIPHRSRAGPEKRGSPPPARGGRRGYPGSSSSRWFPTRRQFTPGTENPRCPLPGRTVLRSTTVVRGEVARAHFPRLTPRLACRQPAAYRYYPFSGHDETQNSGHESHRARSPSALSSAVRRQPSATADRLPPTASAASYVVVVAMTCAVSSSPADRSPITDHRSPIQRILG